MDEIAADFTEQLLTDSESIRQLMNTNPTLADRFFTALREFLQKLTGRVDPKLKKAEQLWTDAYKAAQAQAPDIKLTVDIEDSTKQANTLQDVAVGATIGTTRNYLKDITEAETDALLLYKSSESYKVNAKLRDGLNLTEEENRIVDSLDSILEKLPRVNGTVYRTLSFDDIFDAQEEYDAFLAKHQEGGFAFYKAYTSTSTKADGHPLADGTKLGVTLEITGSSARNLNGFGNNFESEALFPRRSAFIVTKVTVDENGHPYIYIEEGQINGEQNGVGLHSEKRGGAVRDVQEAHPVHADVQGASEADPGGDHGRREDLQGTREKVKFSLKRDIQGRTLTEQQKDYFKDTTTKDDQGQLMVMYHGTRKGGFTVFSHKPFRQKRVPQGFRPGDVP